MKKLRLIPFLFLTVFTFHRVYGQDKTLKEGEEPELCVGNYWTEAEGRAFLDSIRGSYTTVKEWKRRASMIREQILKGAGLDPFPEKCPLNPVFGEKRVYDGYEVRNVAFESLPGVFVTGSLYMPSSVKGRIPAILNTHGHWSQPEDYGRYREDAQKRFVVMARMGAMVFAYDLSEDNIVIEETKSLYPFDDKNPFPENGIRNNDGVKWK